MFIFVGFMINPCGLSLVTEVPPCCDAGGIEQVADSGTLSQSRGGTVRSKSPQGAWTTGKGMA